MTNPTAMVCPRCGQPASDQSFCGGCGLNLAQQAELPSAEEYDARLRQEQWLRAQADTSIPNRAPAARALPDPTTVRARQATRSRLLGSAAAAVAVAFALNWIGAILIFVQSVEGGRTAWQVADGFSVAGNLVLIPAFGSAAAAFLGEASDRATRLRRAALIAAFGFGLLMVATAIRAGVYANDGSFDFITKLVAGESLQATSELSAAIAAAMASVAFLPSRSEPAIRNWWLGLASVALGGVFLLSMVGKIVVLSGLYFTNSAFELGASSAGVGLVAAAIAASAFLLARSPQQSIGDWWPKRDGVLGIAQTVLALAFLLTAIGDAIIAGEAAGGKTIASAWLEFGGDLSLLGAAIMASIGFFILGRLRRH